MAGHEKVYGICENKCMVDISTLINKNRGEYTLINFDKVFLKGKITINKSDAGIVFSISNRSSNNIPIELVGFNHNYPLMLGIDNQGNVSINTSGTYKIPEGKGMYFMFLDINPTERNS